MSIMAALKTDIGGKSKKKDKAASPEPVGQLALPASPSAPAPEQLAKMKGAPPQLSASPRANLLPPEIGQNQRKAAVRRGLRLGVVAAFVVVALGVAGSVYLEISAQAALANAQAEKQALAAQLGSFSDVQTTIDGVAQGKAATLVAGSTDIDWSSYLKDLQASLPADVTLTDVTISTVGAQGAFAQSTVPLEQPRIAELTFTAETLTLPSIPSWINGLSDLKGFADASPQSLTNSDGVYTAAVTMHINSGAFSHRYDLTTEEAGQ